MSLTYNEILNEMKTAFFLEKGEPVKELSDLELRFRAVASEIYSVAAYGNFILRQGFPQTASGEYLDRHAALRSIKRKTASFASGELTFSLAAETQADVTVPVGTVCSVFGSPYIQFATDENAVIPAGEISVTVGATALKAGDEYNAAAGEVTVMVNPPDYVFSVTNEKAFAGGSDEESDEALRERIISSYSSVKFGLNAASLREMILTLDDVTDAYISVDDDWENTVVVCLKTRTSEITQEIKDEVSNLLGFAALCGIELDFISASEQPFDVIAEVKVLSGYNKDDIKAETEERIKAFCSAEKIGKSYSASAIAAACRDIEGVEYIDAFVVSGGAPDAITCGATQYLKLKNTEVSVHE